MKPRIPIEAKFKAREIVRAVCGSPLRVVFALPTLHAGGAQRVIATLARCLDKQKFHVTVLVGQMTGSLYDHVLPGDVDILDLGTSRVRYAWPAAIRAIRRMRPDVVLTTTNELSILLCAARRLLPDSTRLVVRPTIMLGAYLATLSGLDPRRLLYRKLFTSCDALVLQSPEMAADYEREIGAKRLARTRLVVIRNPVALGEISRSAGDTSADTGYKREWINLVSSGRLEHQKGFDIAIEAMARLDRPNASLTILGSGSQEAELNKLAGTLGVADRVRLIGYKSNPYPFYRQANGFLLSSRFEGFPNVVLESLACGTPVVSTPVAGLTALLKGIPGCQVSSSTDPASLARAMREFIDGAMPRVELSAIAYFDAPLIARQYGDLFEEIVTKREGSTRMRSEIDGDR